MTVIFVSVTDPAITLFMGFDKYESKYHCNISSSLSFFTVKYRFYNAYLIPGPWCYIL